MPKGLIIHIAAETDAGMRVIDVWESEADFDRFREERIMPIRDEMVSQGTAPAEPPQEEELKLVDVWGPSVDISA